LKGKDIEKISNKMEAWHNKLFPPLTIFLLISSMIISLMALFAYAEISDNLKTTWDASSSSIMPYFVFQVFFYLGTFMLPIYLFYTRVFTKFSFPIDFKGDGFGRKVKPIVPF